MFPATGSTMIAREPLAVALDRRRDRLDVVERADQRVRGGAGRHAGRRGDAERREARAGGGEQRVGVTVVAARELEDPVAAGGAAGEADRAHRRLGPRGDEAHLLDRRHRVDDLLGELDLALRSARRTSSRARRLLDGRDDLRVRVAEDERPPRHDPVDVAVPVDVLDVGPLAAGDEERLVRARPRRIARTGELTPPGITSAARWKSPRAGLTSHSGELLRPVGHDHVRARALDRDEALEGGLALVEPAARRRRP